MFHAAKLPINTRLTGCACTLRLFSIFFTITSSVSASHLLVSVFLILILRNISQQVINLYLIYNQLIDTWFCVSTFNIFRIQRPCFCISFLKLHIIHPHLISQCLKLIRHGNLILILTHIIF
ncbi:hypothetical protein HanIR_Chr06g0293021 [Helianthus annuus]|nr:hypothetical protein HanIR_Chr06g0293021 [Helianthus annuus]